MESTPFALESAPSPEVILSTLNARYIHASLGLRYLLANMARHGDPDLARRTLLREYTISQIPQYIADDLVAALGHASRQGRPIIGFGVYIWNARQTLEVMRLLKSARPDILIVLGGPEVSYELESQIIVELADYVVTGWGDISFPKLCLALRNGLVPLGKIVQGEQPPLDQIALPYSQYTWEDLAHRLTYVEASRGCPFKCEFCLSSLDKTAWAFDLNFFLRELDTLYQRGARGFKFVDRTFNLKIDSSAKILQFFLQRLTPDLSLHFEVIPDHLPDRLKVLIKQFPPGVLQFEIGIQSFDVAVQERVSRRQDNDQTEANILWLMTQSNAHLHTDLIFGLPGESLESFSAGFDRLYALKPHEIQLGILKRLRGTPIIRHTDDHEMIYAAEPPYAVLQTKTVDAHTMCRFVRLSRYWDLIANSGRFKQSLWLLLNTVDPAVPGPSSSAFHDFMQFSDWLWAESTAVRGKTSGIAPEALVDALYSYLTDRHHLAEHTVRNALLTDYVASGARGRPACLIGHLPERPPPRPKNTVGHTQRQARHLTA